MSFRSRRTAALSLIYSPFLLIAMAISAGCDSGPKIGRVTGEVTFKSKNVPEGTVTFYPVLGGRPAIGRIQPDGVYRLSTFASGDGAVLGDYTVAIEAKHVASSAPAPKSLEEELAQEGATVPIRTTIEWLVPERYSSAESSGLTAVVNGGENKIDFNLP
jgi:hypothetical protein